MAEPRSWTQEEIDADMGIDEGCPNCGGEGVIYDCFDGFCIDAESGCDDCARRCDWCRPTIPREGARAQHE